MKTGIQGLKSTFDWPLLAIILGIISIGIINLQSASAAVGMSLYLTQLLWILVGGIIATGLVLVDYRNFERWTFIFYGIVVFLLIAVLFIGREINGSVRWINMGFFHIQPSELMKISTILITAKYFYEKEKPEGGYSLWALLPPFLLISVAGLLILKEPDLGTTLMVFFIFFSMALFEKIRTASLIVLLLLSLTFAPIGWFFVLTEYQKDRITSFHDLKEDSHTTGWQVRQSIIAVGSGRVFGKGHLKGTQVQKGFVPEPENDFALALWAEEHGFMGILLLLGLYVALTLWSIKIAREARDKFGVHIAIGVGAMIFWHVIINFCMVLKLMPVVGITLPLISYGGSSVIINLMGIGLLMNVSMRRHIF